jgi:hypothetical protein
VKVEWLRIPSDVAPLLDRAGAAHQAAWAALDARQAAADASLDLHHVATCQVVNGKFARFRATFEAHKRRAPWAT